MLNVANIFSLLVQTTKPTNTYACYFFFFCNGMHH